MNESRNNAGPHRLVSRIAPLTLLVLLAFPAPALALEDHIRFEPAIWDQSLDASAAIDGDILPGTLIDLEDTLGVDPDDTSPMGRLRFRWGKSSLTLDYADTSYGGDHVLTESFTFDDETYTATERVVSEFDLKLLQARYRYSFVDLKVVEFGLGLGLNLLQTDARLDGSTSGVTASDEDVPFPTLNAALVIKPLPGFAIRAEIDGLAVTVSGEEVDTIDARLQVEKYFAHVIGIFAGYRSFRFDVDSDDFGSANITFDGYYAGLGLRF